MGGGWWVVVLQGVDGKTGKLGMEVWCKNFSCEVLFLYLQRLHQAKAARLNGGGDELVEAPSTAPKGQKRRDSLQKNVQVQLHGIPPLPSYGSS